MYRPPQLIQLLGENVTPNEVELDREVLQAMLERILQTIGAQQVVISMRTSGIGFPRIADDASGIPLRGGRVIPLSAAYDFEVRNDVSQRIYGLECKCEACACGWLSGEKLDELFRDGAIGGWAEFEREYPKASGLVSLSIPGYSADRNAAVVYWSWSRGVLASDGYVSLLRRRAEGWDVSWTEHYLSS